MSRMRLQCPDSGPLDQSVVADIFLRHEPDEEEDEEEEDEGDGKKNEDEGEDDGYSE